MSQLTLAIHVPLSDPDYVKGIAEDMRKTRQRMVEFGAISSLQVLKAAEFARQQKSLGYTCNLADVGKGLAAGSDESEGRLEGLDIKKDYVFKITDCSASSLHIVAEPVKNGAARRAFCVDEAGTVLFANDGKGSTCISGGRPLQEMEEGGGASFTVGAGAID